jgi:hypothetical protein
MASTAKDDSGRAADGRQLRPVVRDWRYYHGGIANAPAYQLGISAFGYNPGDSEGQTVYPWVGFRLGVIGELK